MLTSSFSHDRFRQKTLHKPQPGVQTMKETTKTYTERSTGKATFFNAVIDMMDSNDQDASTGLFVLCARKQIEYMYGKNTTLKIVSIEDYDDLNYFERRRTTMANIRFMDASTNRYLPEWVTILNLTDRDYKDLITERA